MIDRNCPKEDFDTQLLSNDISHPSRQLLEACPEMPTIDDIMDEIHQEVISTKAIPRPSHHNHPAIHCKKWGRKQTEDFFWLLSKVGPDFTCMELHPIFRGSRCKRELKNKFRKEQKKDGNKVNRWLDLYYDEPSGQNAQQ